MKMLALWKLVVLLNICSVLQVIADTQLPPVPFQPNLAALFFKSQFATNPQQATICFSQYAQGSSSLNEQYSADYNQCLLNTKVKRDDLVQEMLAKHTELVASTADVCHRMTVCNEMNATLDKFQCHSNAGTLNSKVVYEITANATDYYAMFQEKHHLLYTYQEQCLKSAKRTYVRGATAFYSQLQGCLEGKVVQVTTTEAPAVAAVAVVVPEVNVVAPQVTHVETEETSVNVPLAKFMDKMK